MNLYRRLESLHAEDAPGGFPLTPMIDMVFLLIIFLLFGTMGIGERQLVASLQPTGRDPIAADDGAAWLTVRRAEGGAVEYRVNGGAWVGEAGTAEAELRAALSAGPPGRRVAVDPLAGVSMQETVDAFMLCRHAGAEDVALRTD